MKNKALFVISVLAVMLLSPGWLLAGSGPVKHALIIAVADYPPEGRWPDISSDNDISLIRGALLQQGFTSDHIEVVTDQQASKNLLVQEIEGLTARVNPGDIVVIHYSGHGQQIQDDNNDEIDGYDEAIIPWDAQIRWSDKYHGENHLRDDEIKALTDRLRTKLGPDGNVLLILDACHSGTASRGLAQCRGTELKFSEEGYNPTPGSDNGNYGDISEVDRSKLATMVTISGASQHELNYEFYDQEKDTSYGSLSYAFSKAISKAGKNATYRSLFDMIKVDMSTIAPRQSPQIEGDVDQELFGGEIVEQKPYFMVTDWFDDQNVAINAGNLLGIYDSTQVAFYPIGTVNTEGVAPIALGTITNAMAIESDVSLDRKVAEGQIRNSWAFITRQNYGDNTLNIRIDISSADLKKQLLGRLKEMPRVSVSDQNPDLIVEANNQYTRGNNLHLITPDEAELYAVNLGAGESTEEVVDGVVEEINRYMQVNLLKKIDLYDEELDVSFEIIPVTVKKVGSRYQVDQRLDAATCRNAGNELEFKENDTFIIKVKNNGFKRAYFQILDIRPNNEVTLLYPPENSTRPASEFNLDMKTEKELGDIYVFQAPTGNEYLKLIATSEPIDLRFIVSSRGADSRGAGDMSPFEELLQDSYKGTRAGTLAVPPSSATVYTIPFKVTAK